MFFHDARDSHFFDSLCPSSWMKQVRDEFIRFWRDEELRVPFHYGKEEEMDEELDHYEEHEKLMISVNDQESHALFERIGRGSMSGDILSLENEFVIRSVTEYSEGVWAATSSIEEAIKQFFRLILNQREIYRQGVVREVMDELDFIQMQTQKT